MKSKALVAVLVGLFMLCLSPASALAGSISGSLTDAETGAPVTGFTVCADPGQGGGGSRCVGVPASGDYTIDNLEAGQYRVGFRPYPGNNYVVQYWNGVFGYDDATLVPLAEGEDKTGIDAALEEGAEVTGTVVGAGDVGPIEEAYVCARELAPPGYDECTETDADGTYVIAGLRSGNYMMTFDTRWSAVEYAPRFYDEKAFEDEADELQLDSGEVVTADATMTPAGAIEGTVTGEGMPLEWASVCVYTVDQKKLGCRSPDADGHYRYGGLPAGSYVLEFEGFGFKTEYSGGADSFEAATPVSVQAGETSSASANLGRLPGISGTVTDAETGEPVDGVRVCARPEDFLAHGTSCVTSWQDGSYVFENLEADKYKVSFEADGYAWQYFDGVRNEAFAIPVSVSDAMVSGIDAELLPGGSIAGHVTLAGAGTNLMTVKACALAADGSEVACAFSSSSGIYKIEGLPIGNYKVRFTRSTYVTQYYDGKSMLAEAKTVTVAAGATAAGIDAAMAKVEKPQNTSLPELSGIGKVGETLSCSNGSWSNNPTKYEYYWYRNDQEITTAFRSTYKLVSTDAGKTIRCGVQGGNGAGWATTVALSPTTIQVAAIRQLSVTKSGTGAGTVTSSPAGINCGSSCSMNGNEGDSITLTATPALNSELTGWSGGGCSGAAAECIVTLGAENASVTATFAPITHTVSVAVTGAGSVSAAAGAISICTAATGTCSAPYNQGSEVVLTATPDAHQSFTGWSGCTTTDGTECKVTVDGAESVTATFAPITHQLSVTKTGAGSGTVTSAPAGIDCGSSCTAAFDEGSEVALTAVPAQGSEFTGWSGCTTATGSECKVTVDGAASVTATFAPITHTVSVAVTGAGSVSAASGAISGCTPTTGTCSAPYDQGSEVVLTATPDAHQAFTGWSGCNSSDGTECKVTVDGAESVTANFAPITHQLSVTKTGAGSGTVTSSPAGIDCGSACTGSFEEGESITLTAVPASDSEFTGWSGGCLGTGACEVNIAADTMVLANFTKKPSGGGGGTVPPVVVTPPPPTPTPPAGKPKPLKCKKGFKKKKVRGKARCVKAKKKPKKKRG